MADSEQKAIVLISEAEKKLKSGGGFLSSFFGGSSKSEEAAELFVKAGNNFKLAKKWSDAGNAFVRSALVQLKLDSRHEAASHYVEAANCFRKNDVDESVSCLLKAIDIYTDMGHFSMAAKHHMTIGDIFGTERINLEKAIIHYEQAADFYKGEESNSSANKNFLKVAQYSAQLEKYEKAISIYEQVGESSMENQLLRYGAKDHFFKAALCRMIQYDHVDAHTSLHRYETKFPSFQDSRENKFLKAVIAALEEEDADKFATVVSDYDSISRLDTWTTTMLLRLKKSIPTEEKKHEYNEEGDLL